MYHNRILIAYYNLLCKDQMAKVKKNKQPTRALKDPTEEKGTFNALLLYIIKFKAIAVVLKLTCKWYLKNCDYVNILDY